MKARRGHFDADTLAWAVLVTMLLSVAAGIGGRLSGWYVPRPEPYPVRRR
jgi:hypothetical protein